MSNQNQSKQIEKEDSEKSGLHVDKVTFGANGEPEGLDDSVLDQLAGGLLSPNHHECGTTSNSGC